MTPRDLLAQFITAAPGFEAAWAADDNCYMDDDGTFTFHDVCLEFTSFLRDHPNAVEKAALGGLFVFVEEHLVEQGAPYCDLGNALCTCLLEGMSSEEFGEAARPFMGPKTRRFFDQWHDWPP